MTRKLLLWIVWIPLLPLPVQAQGSQPKPCVAPDSGTMSSILEYVVARNHLASEHELSLAGSNQANDDCYWKLEYEDLSSQKTFTLYLTPDHRYLVPAIYDRSVDPLAEERKESTESQRLLIAGRAASKGPKSATVTLVEFSDFQCPYCQRLTTMLETQVLPDEPDVRVVFRNFPLPMHPWAQQAAQIAACAQMQNDAAFWKLHDYIFTNQKDLSASNIEEKLAAVADADAGLNHDAFHDCLNEALTMGPVSKDVALGNRLGVHATPTLFINGTKIEGVRDAAQLKALIAQARSGEPVHGSTAVEGTKRTLTPMARPSSTNGSECGPAN
jgi:protein-disulfide isomerase